VCQSRGWTGHQLTYRAWSSGRDCGCTCCQQQSDKDGGTWKPHRENEWKNNCKSKEEALCQRDMWMKHAQPSECFQVASGGRVIAPTGLVSSVWHNAHRRSRSPIRRQRRPFDKGSGAPMADCRFEKSPSLLCYKQSILWLYQEHSVAAMQCSAQTVGIHSGLWK
jgi:hypothetical protein